MSGIFSGIGGAIIGIGRALLPNPFVRAIVLKGLRQGATWASGLLLAFLLRHGVNGTDASGIAQDVAGLVLLIGSAALNYLDATRVDKSEKQAVASTATAVAVGIAGGATTAADVIASVQDGPHALSATLAALKAGQA